MSQKHEDNDIDEEENEQPENLKVDAKEQSSAMKRMQSFGEEKEGSLKGFDTEKIKAIFSFPQKAEKKKLKQKLESITIKEEDVQLLIKEVEISRREAEKSLRQNDGNLEETLKYWLSL